MEWSIEREDGKIYLACREIGGPSVTIVFSARGANTISSSLAVAANAPEDFAGAEFSTRGELEVKT